MIASSAFIAGGQYCVCGSVAYIAGMGKVTNLELLQQDEAVIVNMALPRWIQDFLSWPSQPLVLDPSVRLLLGFYPPWSSWNYGVLMRLGSVRVSVLWLQLWLVHNILTPWHWAFIIFISSKTFTSCFFSSLATVQCSGPMIQKMAGPGQGHWCSIEHFSFYG